MYHRVMTACLVLSLSACSNVEPIASSPVTLAAGSNEIKLQSPVTPHFRRSRHRWSRTMELWCR